MEDFLNRVPEGVRKTHEKISKQYADAYIEAVGVDGSIKPQYVHSFTKLERMRKLRDTSIQRLLDIRREQQLVTN